MALSELTDPDAVDQALDEFDRLGQHAFLLKYGFRRSQNYLLERNGKRYDSKAIVGAAYGKQFPDRGALRPNEFSGGDATVRRRLEELGFTVVSDEPPTDTTLSDVLARVLELQASWSNKDTPEMALRGRLIRNTGARALQRLLMGLTGLGFTPAVEGRDGAGFKSRVPWMRAFDRTRSPSATIGWYVVILFATDGATVYLSLNQGTTTTAKGDFRSKSASFLADRVAWARATLGDVDDERLQTSISLKDPRGLGEGYEKGNVFAYRYPADELPDENALQSDLATVLTMLDRIYGTESESVEPPQPTVHDDQEAINASAQAWETLRQETLWGDEELRELVEALRGSSRQVVLAGPPGTGKTRVATALARFLTDGDKRRWRLVQFHPTYGYEEFVEGLRPTVDNNVPVFAVQNGIVRAMVDDMTSDDVAYVLVIDEMNRANLPRVFGELMYLLEYRDEPVDLQYSRDFRLPRNLLFIGTMNTADRSIRSIDVALRRRFEIFDCPPDRRILERYYETVGRNSVTGLFDGFDRLNEALTTQLDKHHAVGHTFFMAEELTAERLRRVWRRQIGPLIEEYFFDQPDVAAEFTLERFWPNL